jgi:hypothetical protein
MNKKLLGPDYKLSLPKSLGGEMVMAISIFKEPCPECSSSDLCNHLEIDHEINGGILHMCSCPSCGFIWYCKNNLVN